MVFEIYQAKVIFFDNENSTTKHLMNDFF